MARPDVARALSGLSEAAAGFQLCRFWFESVYEPGLWTVDGLRGDRDKERIEAFWRAFDEEERSYLERFNRFVELRLEMTPEELGKKGEVDPDRWAGIVRDARNTLELIEPNFSATRKTIETVLKLKPANPGQP